VATPAPTAKPTAKPTPKPTEAAASREYRVKSGDTLSSIAARFRVTVEALVTLNDIEDPRLIRTGQVLRIP
jgi:LysM repeat protein